jgi:OFA family oxalate/formate antiporter-like MFS transporter
VSINLPGSNKLYYGWIIVLVGFVSSTIVFGIQYSFGIFFTAFQDEFGWSRATTSLVMTIHLATFALVMIPVGWAVDHLNVRALFSIAAAVIGIVMVLCSRITQLWQLYLLYGMAMGMAVSVFGPVIMTIVTRWFTRRRGLALGIASSGVGFGTLVMAPLSHYLITAYGWRNSFTILGIASGIILLICAQFMRRSPAPGMEDGDIARTGNGNRNVHSSDFARGLTLRQVLKTREILLILVAQVFIGFTVRATMVHISPHAIDIGISASVAALTTGAIGGVSIVGRVAMGLVQDRVGAQRSMIICMTVQALSMLALPFLKVDAAFFIFALTFGFAYGGDVPQIPVITAQCFGLVAISTVYGLVQTLGNLAGASGPLIAGYVFDRTGSYTVVFLSAGFGLLVGVFCISRLKPRY